MKKIKWGIMGPGKIAHKFAQSLQLLTSAELVAIGSRNLDRAKVFAEKYDVKRVYGSYDEFIMDPEVDLVYIATTNQSHFECAMQCLKAGKGVLLEKPFTIGAEQAKILVDTARGNEVFLMEAMWMRFLPVMAKIRELLAENTIGEVRMVKADYGFQGAYDPERRQLNLKLGGGALMDVGIYPLSFAAMVLGVKPEKVISAAFIGETGVDEQCSFTLSYKGGELAELSSAVRTYIPDFAYILGTDGYIKIPEFSHANSFELNINGKSEIFELLHGSNGFTYQAQEAMKCFSERKMESDIMPLDETVDIMKIMDHIHSQWGLEYPVK
jgi:dihydrodiol dehydrogenase / D-xylose 1-dehydrogenase (NADP)